MKFEHDNEIYFERFGLSTRSPTLEVPRTVSVVGSELNPTTRSALRERERKKERVREREGESCRKCDRGKKNPRVLVLIVLEKGQRRKRVDLGR